MNKTELIHQFDSIKAIDATLTLAIKLQTTKRSKIRKQNSIEFRRN